MAVAQDPLGVQGRKGRDNGPRQVFMKPLADGSRAVIFFNRGTEAGKIAISWEDIGLSPGGKALVRDLWKNSDLGLFDGRFEAKVEPHDVVMARATTAICLPRYIRSAPRRHVPGPGVP